MGRSGGEARDTERIPQRGEARTWASPSFDADCAFGPKGVDRLAYQSRAGSKLAHRGGGGGAGSGCAGACFICVMCNPPHYPPPPQIRGYGRVPHRPLRPDCGGVPVRTAASRLGFGVGFANKRQKTKALAKFALRAWVLNIIARQIVVHCYFITRTWRR
jgi:hypothetical protein